MACAQVALSLADVIVDGENLADILVESGVAVRYDGGKKNRDWCE